MWCPRWFAPVVALLFVAPIAQAREETRTVPAPAPRQALTAPPPELDDLLGPAREPDVNAVLDPCSASRRNWDPGPPGPHRHRITATPEATVYLGDVCLGRTPLTLRPPAGATWQVEIRRTRYRTERLAVRRRWHRVELAAAPPAPEPLFFPPHCVFRCRN
ncbi:MAG: hypothetical protein AB8I08_27115 [Sandaracinaceae bacterium]